MKREGNVEAPRGTRWRAASEKIRNTAHTKWLGRQAGRRRADLRGPQTRDGEAEHAKKGPPTDGVQKNTEEIKIEIQGRGETNKPLVERESVKLSKHAELVNGTQYKESESLLRSER
jgi:hypothetical protein